jgi:hypothetical protein
MNRAWMTSASGPYHTRDTIAEENTIPYLEEQLVAAVGKLLAENDAPSNTYTPELEPTQGSALSPLQVRTPPNSPKYQTPTMGLSGHKGLYNIERLEQFLENRLAPSSFTESVEVLML